MAVQLAARVVVNVAHLHLEDPEKCQKEREIEDKCSEKMQV